MFIQPFMLQKSFLISHTTKHDTYNLQLCCKRHKIAFSSSMGHNGHMLNENENSRPKGWRPFELTIMLKTSQNDGILLGQDH